MMKLKNLLTEAEEDWTGRDLIDLKKQILLSMKSLNGVTRNLQKLEKMMEGHKNKPQGKVLLSMTPNFKVYKLPIAKVVNKVAQLEKGLGAMFTKAWKKA